MVLWTVWASASDGGTWSISGGKSQPALIWNLGGVGCWGLRATRGWGAKWEAVAIWFPKILSNFLNTSLMDLRLAWLVVSAAASMLPSLVGLTLSLKSSNAYICSVGSLATGVACWSRL